MVGLIALTLGVLPGCATSDRGAQEAARRDYDRLSGTWRLVRAVVNGTPVPEPQVKQTILITDGNTFRFPQAAGVGTHPAGTFTINPSTVPPQVDSLATGGATAGQLTLGIYEIIDDTHKRACWGPPGGPRPTAFESPPGSGRILQYWEKIGPVPAPSSRSGPELGGDVSRWIDVHTHLIGDRGDYRGAVAAALAAMDDAGIEKIVVMPPPHVSGGRTWDLEAFLPVLAPRARFAFLGGGGTLNPMIQDTKPEAVDEAVRRRFEARAEEIMKHGAAGFGEITAHHLSHMSGHPYESVDADHPLLRLLADVAARHGAVIDFHFDVVAEDMNAPAWLASPPNPPTLRANLPAFERLLAHNRRARIVWAHAGSDMLGWWTADLSRRLLSKHANLFMSLRLAPGRAPQNSAYTRDGVVRPEWLALFRDFPDRFVLGGDQFFVSPTMRGEGPGVTFSQRAPLMRQRSRAFLAALPPDLARRIGADNAIRLYKLQ
jgi:uncharacterized protein (TIGR03067 family)